MTPARMFGIDRSALHGLRWQGGKSQQSPTGTGRWIASQLPVDADAKCYVEPYAGMLGILLRRPRAPIEIANDLNGRIINWWRVVRDRTDEFQRYMLYTPDSEVQFGECMESMDEGSEIERAAKFHVATTQSLFGTDAETNGGYACRWTNGLAQGTAPLRGGGSTDFQLQIARLADRLRHVQLLARPAVEIVRRIARSADALTYIDPPYPDTFCPYVHSELDIDELTDALDGHAGRVAISGYGDAWDHLDWRRTERPTWTPLATGGAQVRHRCEVLWTNFDPPTQGSFL